MHGRGRLRARARATAKPIQTPHLQNRDVACVKTLILSSMFAPTRLLFQLIWETVRLRFVHVYAEQRRCDYFFPQYIIKRDDGLWTPSWFMMLPLRSGLPPSQQTAEEWNTKLKCDFETLPKKLHLDVCNALATILLCRGGGCSFFVGEESFFCRGSSCLFLVGV